MSKSSKRGASTAGLAERLRPFLVGNDNAPLELPLSQVVGGNNIRPVGRDGIAKGMVVMKHISGKLGTKEAVYRLVDGHHRWTALLVLAQREPVSSHTVCLCH